jgi:predicted Zn finger-like uncharacterized protein
MVITCPSCSARYRLNPDKIKGRGAKITCPKCSHIFVVFADGGSTPGTSLPEPPEAAASPPPTTPPQAASSLGAGDRSTASSALARRDKDTTTGAFRAVGLADREVPSASTTGSIRVVAPGPRKSRRAVATIDTNSSLPAVDKTGDKIEMPAVEEGDAPAYDGPEPTSASDLDFREVGITTWKVKVAIGLIYDFSDIATLKKYLTDKKVTEDDLISHDGKDWDRIGDIGDLDQHFIETWKSARAKAGGKKEKAAPKPAAEKPAEAPGARSTGAYPSQTGSYGATGGMAAAQKAPRRPRKPKAKVEEKRANRMPLIMLAAVVVLAVVAWFVFANPDDGGVQVVSTTGQDTPSSVPEVDEAEQERIRRQVREQVEAQREALIREQEETDRAAEAEEATPELEPVTPPSGRADRNPGALPAPVRDIPTRTLPAPGANVGSNDEAEVSVAVTATDRNGQMYFDKGKQQFLSGNYGSAKTMLKKAVSKCDGCGDYWEYLGKTHQALGEVDEAAAAFSRAQALGASVNTARP